MNGSPRPTGVCSVGQFHCAGVGFGIKIKDPAGFKRRWILSMLVANASTPRRT